MAVRTPPSLLASSGRRNSPSTHEPLAPEGVQTLAAVFADEQCLAELKPHLFVMRNHVRLDDDHHVFAEDHFAAFMAGGRAALNDRRVLTGSMNQVVVDAVAAAMDDLCGLFGFAGGCPVLDRSFQELESFHRDIMH